MTIEGQTGAGSSETGNTPGETPPPATPPPATGTPPQGAMPNQPQAIPDGNIDALPAWAKTLIGNLRSSERKLKTYEDRDKTETEKLQARIAELESGLTERDGKIRDYTLSGVFESEAAKIGALDPKLLYQVAKGQIETDKDGKPTNLTDVLKSLKASHPSQFREVRRTPNVDAGAAGGNATQGGQGSTANGVSVTDFMRGQIGRLGG